MTYGPSNRNSAGPSRRYVLAAVGTALTLPLSAVAQQTRTLRYGSLFNPDHTSSRSSDHFAELVGKKTGGRLQVQVFHNAQLGNEVQVGEGVRSGTIDVGFAGSSGFGGFIRDIRVLELPYLYSSFDKIHAVFTQVWPTLTELFSANGIQLLGNIYEGPRMTLATRPLRTLQDLKGLKLRVPQAAVYIEMAKALGAIPTPVALPEVYTALQAKVADGLEGAPSTLLTGKYYEVAKHLMRTDHVFNATYIGMNPAVFKALPPEFQAAVIEAGREATVYNLELVKKAAEADLDQLAKVGITIVSPDLAPFRAAVAGPNERYAQGLGGRAMELFGIAKQVGNV